MFRGSRPIGLLFGIFCGVAILGFGVPFAWGATYDAVTQFFPPPNVATNTWSYWGTTNTDVNKFFTNVSLLSTYFPNCGFGTTCWDASSGPDNLILRNVTGADALFPNSDARNNQLTYYTRSGIVDVRFLVPTTGTYSLTGFFEGSALIPQITREVIALNGNVGAALFDSTGAVAFGTINPFSFGSLSLNSGDVVDFLVEGVSTTFDFNSLATGFTATFNSAVSTVPEPSAIAIMGSAIGGVLGFVRFRRRRGDSAYRP